MTTHQFAAAVRTSLSPRLSGVRHSVYLRFRATAGARHARHYRKHATAAALSQDDVQRLMSYPFPTSQTQPVSSCG